MNVYQKLQKARVELQNMGIKKSGKNSFSKFSYFELADFLPGINQVFNDVGLASVFILEDGRATLSIVNAEKPDEIIMFTSPVADAQMKGVAPIQSLGATHTYLKRYLYFNAMEIVESDMLDYSVGRYTEDSTASEASPKSAVLKKIIKDIAACKTTESLEAYVAGKAALFEAMPPTDKEAARAAYRDRMKEIKTTPQ